MACHEEQVFHPGSAPIYQSNFNNSMWVATFFQEACLHPEIGRMESLWTYYSWPHIITCNCIYNSGAVKSGWTASLRPHLPAGEKGHAVRVEDTMPVRNPFMSLSNWKEDTHGLMISSLVSWLAGDMVNEPWLSIDVNLSRARQRQQVPMSKLHGFKFKILRSNAVGWWVTSTQTGLHKAISLRTSLRLSKWPDFSQACDAFSHHLECRLNR